MYYPRKEEKKNLMNFAAAGLYRNDEEGNEMPSMAMEDLLFSSSSRKKKKKILGQDFMSS